MRSVLSFVLAFAAPSCVPEPVEPGDTGDTGDTAPIDTDTADTDTDTADTDTADTDTADTSPAPCHPRVVTTTALGDVPPFPGTTSHHGGVSVVVGGVASWLWVDTRLEVADADGYNVRGSTASVLAGADPLDAGAWTATDTEVLPAVSGDTLPIFWGASWSSPYGVLAATARDGDAVLFAKKTTLEGAAGVALATWDGAAAALLPGDGADPTVIFAADDPFQPLAAALTVGADVYAYDCHITYAAWGCTLGRAPAAEVGDRGAWEVWDGAGWSTDATAAAEVFTGGAQMSVHWSAYLGKYVAIYGNWADTEVWWRTADAPEGPWSAPAVLFETERIDPDAWEFVWTAQAHPELAVDGGRVEYVTHSFGEDTRVVEVEFTCEE